MAAPRVGSALFIRESDASLDPLRGVTVAVLGYGHLGRSIALNLRDSGIEVLVGNIEDQYRVRAAADHFPVRDIAAAVAEAALVYVLLPDEVIPRVFAESVSPRLSACASVCFASGYSLAYDLVEPPARADVLLLAPRMLGDDVRGCYLDGTGFLSYVSVEQDASGQAEDRLLALALAAGSLRRGAMRLSARQEATLDLLVEQGVGPYLGAAFQIAFALGTEAGLPPEALVCELYMSGEMERVIRTMARVGLLESVRRHGLVAAYGGLWSMETIDREGMERHFRAVLEQIGSGVFARRLQAEEAHGYPTLALLDTLLDGDNPLSAAERRVRGEVG